MKFRAFMSEITPMREFMNAVNSLSKLSKDCVLKLTSTNIFFIISETAGVRKPFVWCDMPVNYYFKEYTIEGVNSEEYNEIYLSLDTVMLAKSLSTLKNDAKSMKIKLTNKQKPCLTLEIEQVLTGSIHSRECIHDIPVSVITVDEWSDFNEPVANDFHVSILLPNLKSVKNIVDRMKSMSSSLIFSASKTGRLTLKISTDMATIAAHFDDLHIQSFAMASTMNNEESICANEEENVMSVVDIKKFLNFLTGMHISNYKTTCSIVHNQMVQLSLQQPGALSIRCYLSEISQ